jgi:hypothetical protein
MEKHEERKPLQSVSWCFDLDRPAQQALMLCERGGGCKDCSECKVVFKRL